MVLLGSSEGCQQNNRDPAFFKISYNFIEIIPSSSERYSINDLSIQIPKLKRLLVSLAGYDETTQSVGGVRVL